MRDRIVELLLTCVRQIHGLADDAADVFTNHDRERPDILGGSIDEIELLGHFLDRFAPRINDFIRGASE